MYIFSADDEDDDLSVDNSIRIDGHGPVTKQDDDVEDTVTKQDDNVEDGPTKQDDDVGDTVTKQDVASLHQSGNNDSEGEEQIIIVRHSKRLKDVRDMKSFIVDDYTEKQKGYKARREDSERRRMAAPYILDQASIALRPPKGYYGNFGENDNDYIDEDDFPSENGNKKCN